MRIYVVEFNGTDMEEMNAVFETEGKAHEYAKKVMQYYEVKEKTIVPFQYEEKAGYEFVMENENMVANIYYKEMNVGNEEIMKIM